jgi:toxin ParE1/3/4
MSWNLVIRPEVEDDIADAALWYETHQPGLGVVFIEEIYNAWSQIANNPFLRSRKHPRKNIRWRYPDRFPYRIIYEVIESTQSVLVLAVLHAARHDRHWQKRK